MGTKMSRRHVLKRSATAALAALAVPQFVPSGVLARPGRAGANDRIVIGGIGVRRMGGCLIRGMARLDGVRVAAVADVDRRVAEAISTPRDEDRVLWAVDVPPEPADLTRVDRYQDYRHILDRQDIDAVVVGTPEHWHALPSIQAAQAGKDIYCEKPLARTIFEGQMMVKAVRKYDRVFQTGTQRRSHADWYQACMLVRNGRLGKIQRVLIGNYSSPVEPPGLPTEPIPETLDWDMWCGPVQPYPFNRAIQGDGMAPGLAYRSYRDFAGGTFTCTGSHLLDLVQWGLGTDRSGPIEVWTEGELFDSRTGRAPLVFMRYPGDITLECTQEGIYPVFIGERGSLTVNEGRLVSDPQELAQEPLDAPQVQLYRSTHHWQNWLDCIKDRRQPVADVEIGHRSVSVGHLANIARWVSERTGTTGEHLQWDPQAERFTNSQWGNHFLDQPRRRKYDLPETI